MNKITLDTFIQKYNLGGNVNSVKWISNGTTLSTKFISGDKSLLGHVELNKQNKYVLSRKVLHKPHLVIQLI